MPPKDRYWLHILLFVLTLGTTTVCGAEWINGSPAVFLLHDVWHFMPREDLLKGFRYSLPFITFLLCHEFGHYFTSRFHRVRASLPYCLPVYFPFSFGTFGAIIRMRERVNSSLKYFDIGIAGPVAGFIIGGIVLVYGFTHLPDLSYIYNIHQEYRSYGGFPPKEFYQSLPDPSIRLGKSLLLFLMERIFAFHSPLMPNGYEMPHYPFLFAGWLACFFTALNLFPMGQLDGGHIVYGLFGSRIHSWVSRLVFLALVFYGGIGLIDLSGTLLHTAISGGMYLIFLQFLFRKAF